MRSLIKVSAITAVFALGLFAIPAMATTGNGHANGHDKTPGPGASLPAKAKAYGKYCQAESKKHVKGEKGTPFSRCVTAMAKLANGHTDNPKKACAGESKKHVKGQKGTPFSLCVKAAAKMKHDSSEGTS